MTVCALGMGIALEEPRVDGLAEVVEVLAQWQDDAGPMQLHPGDVGWFWRNGSEATAAAIRTWRLGGRPVAVGLLDGPTVLRLAIAPDALRDTDLAHRLAEDADDPGRGVLPDGKVCVESPNGSLVPEVLTGRGWATGEPWTQLHRDLAQPVESGARIEVVGPQQAGIRSAVHRASFDGSTFGDENWRQMAAGPPYAQARCLVARDEDGAPVAAATVWSSGPGRPGVIEPLGAHRDHRGRGHGREITIAAAATLRQLGCSSARVATPSSNVAAVAAYLSAGFRVLGENLDRVREPTG